MSNPYDGQSSVQNVAGLSGENTANGVGVKGQGDPGVWGESQHWEGVHGISHAQAAGVAGFNDNPQGQAGVWGESQHWEGVHGISHAQGAAGVAGFNDNPQGGAGMWGESQHGEGVHGISHAKMAGVAGFNDNPQGQAGVWGESQHWEGVHGISHAQGAAGVAGFNDNPQGGAGVWGESQHWEGVHGISHGQAAGVAGFNDNPQGQAGVWGESQHGEGVTAISHSNTFAAISGHNKAGGPAGFFEGNVVVTGDITLTNADCAEHFDVVAAETIESGTVMVLDEHGALRPSQQAYDKKVAGVISGAGDYKPGLILDQKETSEGRMPVALLGKVYCKVDASYAPIQMGDLLTTSPTPGHAMKAIDPFQAFGAVIGKALRPLEAGQGLLPILVALQ